MRPLVLDSAALDQLARGPREGLRALLAEAVRRDRDVLVPAAVIAEVSRGRARTAAVEAVLARRGPFGAKPVGIVALGEETAKQTGAVLHAAAADSTDLVDASVVATCVPHGGGLVVTSDPDDIRRLAEAVPSARIITVAV